MSAASAVTSASGPSMRSRDDRSVLSRPSDPEACAGTVSLHGCGDRAASIFSNLRWGPTPHRLPRLARARRAARDIRARFRPTVGLQNSLRPYSAVDRSVIDLGMRDPERAGTRGAMGVRSKLASASHAYGSLGVEACRCLRRTAFCGAAALESHSVFSKGQIGVHPCRLPSSTATSAAASVACARGAWRGFRRQSPASRAVPCERHRAEKPTRRIN